MPILRAITLTVVLIAAAISPALADITGQARVIDGDTIDIAGERIRLHGIDAPESRQTCVVDGAIWPCGQRAATALVDLIAGAPVSCRAQSKDRYGRTIAACTVRGEDIEAWMVMSGWALAYRRYSLDYTVEETIARSSRAGVWRGKFIEPWEWRKGKRLPTTTSSEAATAQPTYVGEVGPAVSPRQLYLSGIVYFSPSSWIFWLNGQKITPDLVPKYMEVVLVGPDQVEFNITTSKAPIAVQLRLYEAYVVATGTVIYIVPQASAQQRTYSTPSQAATVSDSAGGCAIKGNISSSGERIYHVPGGSYYDRTKINTAKGERWFCTEDEAIAAGWRKPKR